METVSERKTDHRRGWLLFVAIVAVFGFLFAQVHGVKENRIVQAPLVIANPLMLDIGDQWEAKEFHWTLPIKNTTTDDIHIGKFLSRCPCMTFDPPSLTLGAGQEIKVGITCDMTATCGQNRDLPIRDYEMPIAPADVNGEALQKPWVLYGKVRGALQLQQRDINYSDRLTTGQPFPAARVYAKANIPLLDLTAFCPAEYAAIEVKRLDGKDERFEIRIAPNVALPHGPFKFQVALRPIASGASPLPETIVTVEGIVQSDARIEPSAIAFTASKVGQSMEEIVVLRSASKRTFEVQALEVPEDTKVEPIAASPAHRYRVIQRIARRDQQTVRVTFVLRYLDSGRIEKVNLPVSYYGVKR